MTPSREAVTVVGIGADGWSGLGESARRELLHATVLYGSPRQFALVDGAVTAERRNWPTPLLPALEDLRPGDHVLASGDPMFYGIGATLARNRPALTLRVLPHFSSFALACATLAWPAEDVVVVSAVARNPAPVVQALRARRRVIVLSESGATPTVIADLIAAAGLSARITVLEQLGGPRERVRHYSRRAKFDDLNVIAIDPPTATEPFDYEHDGQITKADIRALTVAALEPSNGWIWDFGAGSGSVGITWALSGGGSVVAIDRRADRAERAARNAARAGVSMEVVVADAATLTADLPQPDAIFIGGGLTEQLAAAAVSVLPPGGRLVVNAVTIDSQSVTAALCSQWGGVLRSYTVADAQPLGTTTAFVPRRPIVQWKWVKSAP